MKRLGGYLVFTALIMIVIACGILGNFQSWWSRGIYSISILLCGALALTIFNKLKFSTVSAKRINTLAKLAFDNTALGMCIADVNFKYIAINHAYCEIVGYSKEELLNMTHKDFIHPEDQELDGPNVKQLLEGKIDSFDSTKRYLHKQGHIVWGHATVSVMRDERGKPKCFVTQIQDISTLVETQEQLRKLAMNDYLTGCLNRRAFIDKLGEEIARSKREKSSVSLILMDIDLFKKVNDTFGHLAGDCVLQKFSACLSENSRPYDFIGRYGGEEFIVCLPNTDLQEATAIAYRLRKNIQAMRIEFKNYLPIKITSSLGVATLDYNNIEDVDYFIMRADNALYEAKKTRNTVCVA